MVDLAEKRVILSISLVQLLLDKLHLWLNLKALHVGFDFGEFFTQFMDLFLHLFHILYTSILIIPIFKFLALSCLKSLRSRAVTGFH